MCDRSWPRGIGLTLAYTKVTHKNRVLSLAYTKVTKKKNSSHVIAWVLSMCASVASPLCTKTASQTSCSGVWSCTSCVVLIQVSTGQVRGLCGAESCHVSTC
jgi:hypothetical protein